MAEDTSKAGEAHGGDADSTDHDGEADQRVRPANTGSEPEAPLRPATTEKEPTAFRFGLERDGDSTTPGSFDDNETDPGTLNPSQAEAFTALEAKVVSAAQIAIRREVLSWSAPMPAPDILREYDKILPGAAERILQMAEVAVKGQNDIDSRLADAEISGSIEGRRMAFTLTLVALISSIGFFLVGNVVAGTVLVSMPVALLIRSIFGRASERLAPAEE